MQVKTLQNLDKNNKKPKLLTKNLITAELNANIFRNSLSSYY